MKPVENWKDAWKWLSVHFTLALVVWTLTPDVDKAAILSLVGWESETITRLLALAALVGRFVKQSQTPKEPS